MEKKAPSTGPPSRNEWHKFIKGFGYAFQGIWYGLRTQRNLRIHGVVAIFAILMGILLQISLIEFALICILISCVISAELFNTAIEKCIDLISPDHHPFAKAAKDTAAGAVLVLAIAAVIVGMLLFGPRLFNIFF